MHWIQFLQHKDLPYVQLGSLIKTRHDDITSAQGQLYAFGDASSKGGGGNVVQQDFLSD